MPLPAVEDVTRIFIFVVLATFVLANATLILLFTEVGLMALFAVAFAFVIALFSGTTLLAADFLFPEAVAFAAFSDLLLLIVPISLVTTFLLLYMEEPVMGVSRRVGLGRSWVEIGFVGACGGVFAWLLVLQARYLPDVGLTPGAALAASLVGVFAFYFIELFTIHTGPVSGEYLESQNDEQPNNPDTEIEEVD